MWPDSQFPYFNLCVTYRCDIPTQFLCCLLSKKYYQHILRFKFTLAFVFKEIKYNLRLFLFQIIIHVCFYFPGSIPIGVTGEFFLSPDRTMCPEVDSASASEYQGFLLG